MTLPVLRFIACGSVDDGKSTLIGRLLHEAHGVFDDQLAALEADSRRYGTQGERIDYALLLDGLEAEREQNITIDVAYRYFASARRRFIVADAPGHEQYTRNMATGASTADAAVLLVDARKGLLVQTRRHARIVAMMGIRHVALAVNKMDLVACSEAVFARIAGDFRAFAAPLGFAWAEVIPVSALEGDNVVAPSARMPWHRGATLLSWLETVDATPPPAAGALRMPVQWVNRPHADFRGFCGRIAAGDVAPGDAVRVLPSGVEARVAQVLDGFQAAPRARCGDSVTLTFTEEVDASRGDVVVAAGDAPQVADQFEARLLWMAERPLMPGRPYLMRLHAKESGATVTAIKYREDVDSGARLAARTLGLNEIGVVTLSTAQPLVFEPYATNRVLGGFVLIDKLDFATVGAGMIDFALRRAGNLHWQAVDVDKTARGGAKGQRPRCIWLTGLSGAGKSTIANLLEKRLHAEGRHTYLLDGDNVRHGLNRDLGFTAADRVENIRRVAEVAHLMVDAGLVVIVAFISPFRAERRMARALFAPGEFLEVFVDTPLAECERRDPKGLYAKARRGELANFTGIDSAYERPEGADVTIDTVKRSADEAVEAILATIRD